MIPAGVHSPNDSALTNSMDLVSLDSLEMDISAHCQQIFSNVWFLNSMKQIS